MSDTDTQEPVAADETRELSDMTIFDEPSDAKPEEAEPAETVETPPADETIPADEATEEAEPAPDDTATPEEPAEEEKSESELKGMTRAERKEYFEQQKAEQQRVVGEAVDANYAPQPFDQLKQHYLDQGASDFEAQILADRDITKQEAQIDKAKAEIVELNANLRTDSVEAQAKYDWMNPAKPEVYDKELHQMAADLFATGMGVDPVTKQITSARMTPMEAAALIDKARNSGMAKAQLRAQKAAEQQLAATAPPTSAAPIASAESADDKQASSLERALGNTL